MRVLQINKYHYLRGGAERYYFEASRLLEKAGHEVAFFSMEGERNRPTPWSKHFLPETDYRREASFPARVRAAGRVIWNGDAYRSVLAVAAEFRPDVAHLHNIAHQLSGSVVAALRRAGVPAIQTLHDYKLACPSYRRFRDGKPCDACRRYRFWNAVRYRCVLGSAPASAVAAAETAAYRGTKLYEKGVAFFHAPSRFLGDVMKGYGFPAERIVHFPYTLDIGEYEPSDEEDGTFLFFGRLSPEKGLPVLLRAAARFPEARIVVAGEGPEREGMEREAKANGLSSVRFAGHLGGEDLRKAIRSCRAVLLPSEYDDNSPLVIYESFAYGKPVIGAERGGIPEMVRAGETGLLFPPSDGEALAAAMKTLQGDPGRARRMGAEARRRMETVYGPDAHLEKLLALYERAMASATTG
ncbi:MAG: glycosyltransferase [Candidatus Eisenbacteria bacterium]